MQLPFTEHVHSKLHVFHKGLGSKFIHSDEEKLIDPTEILDRIHKSLVKYGHLGIGQGSLVPQDTVPDRIKESRHVNAVGASCPTSVAGQT